MIDDMQVYIANLGKYNEEELVGDWFSFPLDEEVIAEHIGLNAEQVNVSFNLHCYTPHFRASAHFLAMRFHHRTT